ncbi:hypothetical protein [Falsiroseomonas ponticola]|uniref:hypothetical protein n=1 Tax=Falsiroseomonas ponticola TaxID=2786951 RepID=UPI0019322DA2|nr:hypothetical protein [Roseomonas ponticola]
MSASPLPFAAPFPPAVTVVSPAEAMAALSLAGPRGVTLLSAEGAAGFLGPRAWRVLVDSARAAHPGVAAADLLCCGRAPGDALAALRAGCRGIVLDGSSPAFAAIAAACAEGGAALLPGRPPALEARSLDLRRAAGKARLAAWLAVPPDDTRGHLR